MIEFIDNLSSEMSATMVFATLLFALLLFAWGRIRHDLVALLALFALVVLGEVEGSDAFMGFAHPAVITVAAVLIIGKGLEFSGLVDWLGQWVMKAGTHFLMHIFLLCLIVAIASAFINNVGAIAIMMPVAVLLARKHGYSPSLLLMPIAFASLLGGMTTLIGTPPNIIIATFRADETGEAFGMFDFSPVGILITLLGLAFICLIGWKFLPKTAGTDSASELFKIDEYITEVEVVEKSRIIGSIILDLETNDKTDVKLLGIVRNNQRLHAPSRYEKILLGDILILETGTKDLKNFLSETKTELVADKRFRFDAEGSEKITLMEGVVMADSPILGKTASGLRMRSRFGINLLAVARKDRKITRRIDHVIFQTGDVLLLQGRDHVITETLASIGCLPLAQRNLNLNYKTQIPLAVGIFVVSIGLVISNLLPVQIAFSMAAAAMVLTGVLPVKEFYASIDWPVIVLLGAMIPVGVALETSGGAAMIASLILVAGQNFPPWMILAIILIITMGLSDIINNAATVVLMAPIAMGVAKGLGHSIDPYLMTVAIGGSCAFLTPIGHQSNTLVMSPGGYKFTDYWKMGLPLEAIIVVFGIPLILFFWPI